MEKINIYLYKKGDDRVELDEKESREDADEEEGVVEGEGEQHEEREEEESHSGKDICGPQGSGQLSSSKTLR